tara:strand:- start:46129 stop:47874 length:1746 start_codon:yes stop_codon:yes gene_type:complete
MKKMKIKHHKQFLGLKLLHWTGVLASLALTLVAWRISASQYEARVEARFNQQADLIVSLIQERLHSYADGLWAGVAFYYGNNAQISYEEWKTFSGSMNLPKKYPGINGIGVIFYVPPNELDKFLAKQRKNRPDFAIHHSNDTIYYPITYIEPQKGNEEAVGLDISFEKNRLKAAEKARDTGNAQMTGPIILVQDEKQAPGFLFYAPFYDNKQLNSAKKPRGNFKGMVYAPFIVEKLVYGVLAPKERLVNVSVSDDDVLLYSEHLNGSKPLFSKKISKSIYGREWTFDIRTNERFKKAFSSAQSNYILISGIIIDLLLIILFFNLSRSQERAVRLAEKMTEEAKLHRQSAEQASKLAALGEMAAGIAHEINNPLSVILGYSALLKELEDSNRLLDHPQEVKTATTKIESSVKRITNIINGLRQFSRKESGEDKNVEKLNAIIKETVEFAKEGFKVKTTEIVLNLDKEARVLCNKVQISQVLINLLNNAQLEASKSEEKEIKVTTRLDRSSHTVRVSISNSGSLIPEEIHDKIFQPFFTTKKAGEGTGIGLSISKNLIEAHGGQLYLDANQPITTFVIELPVV